MDRKKTRFDGVYTLTGKRKRYQGRPDVCYYITYWAKGPEGRRKKIWEKIGWLSDGFSAQRASELRSERINYERGVSPASRKMTLDQAWTEYESKHAVNLKDYKTEKSIYSKHVQPQLGHRRLQSITAYDLQLLKARLTDQGYAPATIKHVLIQIRAIYNRMKAWKLYTGDNPVAEIKLPKVDNARYRFLTRDEAHKLLQEIGRRSGLWYMISLVSLHCGLRAGEIFALRGQHLDFETRIIQVIDPKFQSRQAFMTPAVAAVLKASATSPGDLVFQKRGDGPIREVSETVKRSIEALGLNAGVSDRRGRVVFHTFRHTFASWLAISGWPLYVIAELMGHSTLEMARRYSHLIPSSKQSAVSLLGQYFSFGQMSGQGQSPNTFEHLFDDIK